MERLALATKLCLPVLCIGISGAVWPMGHLGDKVSWRPPAKVFGLAWAALAAAIGLAWAFGGAPVDITAVQRNAAFGLLLLLLTGFAPLVNIKGPGTAPAVCAGSLGGALVCVLCTAAPYNVTLVPLCAWLVYAGQLASQLA